MILGLILIAILCMVTVAAAYDTSGDRTIDHEIASAHVQYYDALGYQEEMEDRREEARANHQMPKWSTSNEIQDGYQYYEEQVQEIQQTVNGWWK